MAHPSNRRKFLKHLGVGSIGATIMPTGLLNEDQNSSQTSHETPQPPAIASKHAYNESYTEEHLNRIAFPIGGIGAGMFCIEGAGAISHMSIRHRPEVFNEPGLFGAIYVKGLKNGAKIVEGPVPDWKKFWTSWCGQRVGRRDHRVTSFSKGHFQSTISIRNH